VVKEVGPDIVHTWMYSANFWGCWAALTCGVSHLVASHRGVVQRSGRIERLSERLLAGRTLRLANSQAIARSLEKHFCLPVDRTRVIYNAVSLPAVDREEARQSVRQELALRADTKLILMVGRLVWEKNYAMFVRTAGRVCGQRGDVVFLAAGTGPDERDLRAQVESAALTQRVRFLGFRADVPRLLAAADIFCFTSLSEGFPNAVLEAMLAGLPVVCTAFPSMSELLSDSDQAVLVPIDDDAVMASQIVALLDDPDRCQRMGAAAQARVRSRYVWEQTVASMESIYDGLMRNGP
jgi:glycosyltransferase involved in cell wall biosynthesis